MNLRLITVFITVLLTSLGCLGSNQTLYVCPSGETVSDTSLCPKTTASPSIETVAPATTIPATIAPTTTPPTTLPATTATAPPTTAPPTTTPPPEDRPILEIIDETPLSGPGDEFWIGGKIRNNGDVEQFYVQAYLVLYDKFGTAIETKKSAPLDKILPGETVEFNIIKASKLRPNVAGYNLTAQAGR